MAKRLFIALELPARCRESLAAVAEPVVGVRWLPEDQFHLTLAFLGTVDAETEEHLRDTLSDVRVPAFSLRLCGVRMFRGRRSAVIWAGVEDAHDDLMTLHGEVVRAVAAAHIKMKAAPFHPHISLARLKEVNTGEVETFLEANQRRHFGTVDIEGFTLFSSVLLPVGAVHQVEERYALVSR